MKRGINNFRPSQDRTWDSRSSRSRLYNIGIDETDRVFRKDSPLLDRAPL